MEEAVAAKALAQVTPPSKVEGPSQTDLNITSYEEIFSKCLEAAKRLSEKHSLAGDAARVEVATELFFRFYEDQGDVNRAKASGREQRETIRAAISAALSLKTGSLGMMV